MAEPEPIASRWWYWIAAYPLAALLSIPLSFVLILAIVGPLVLLGNEPAPGVTVGVLLVVLLGIVVVSLFLVILIGIFVALPIAIYFDARVIAAAGRDWSPDPVIYAVLAALQFVVTPLIGLIVALYYLYRRHEEVGVP